MSITTSPDARKGLLDRIVVWIAPIMPWFFLTLRRALIPTLGLVMLAALFYLVPQSREVLLGLTDPSQTSQVLSSPLLPLDFTALISYFVASVALSLAIWYSARLLCTVEAWLGMPAAWRIRNLGPRWAVDEFNPAARKFQIDDEESIRRAIKWLPRAYGVTALAAAMGALIFANRIVMMDRPWALLLVASCIAGPLLIVWGWAMRTYPCDASRKKELMQVASRMLPAGVVVFLAALGALAYHTSLAVWVVNVIASILPAVQLIFVVFRRAMGWFKSEFKAESALEFDDVIKQVFAFVSAGFVVLLVLALSKPYYVRGVGSAATVMIFLAAAVLFVSGLQIFLRRISRSVPGFTSAVAIVAFIAASVVGCEPLGKEKMNTAAHHDPDAAVQSQDTNASGDTPRLIVNAYGGGLRAAIYTAEVLALADDASCGRFGKQIEAMSGVSGGSLGIAVYLVARQELIARGGLWEPCRNDSQTPLTDVVSRALGQDHLSPVIARTLSVDLVPFMDPRRGQAILDSWNDALEDALVEAQPKHKDDFGAPLAMSLDKLSGGISPKPLVFFNATDADTGNIVWFSNGVNKTPFSNVAGTAPLVGQAVLHSARFPVVTPAGEYKGGARPHRLVDGGYADNSGAQTLVAEMWLKRGNKSDDHAVLIDINGNPPDVDQDKKRDPATTGADKSACKSEPPKQSVVPTAVLALLRARSAHADRAAQQLSNLMPRCKDEGGMDHCLKPVQLRPELPGNNSPDAKLKCDQLKRARTAPLGWYTGAATAALVATASRATVYDMCRRAGLTGCKSPTLQDPSQGRPELHVVFATAP